ncbi:MAG: FKBP-type peptidyl-prolyl cis-trans isomerase [Pyrinomonadaceae bacterium]|nr:FKBP-type peptidyl-prolyl cis-trans isomerase [Pyrinomonadaceae bacterium]
MKKSIFAIVLMLSVCAGFAFSQTKRKTVRRPLGKATVKKTIVRKKIMTMESNAVTTASGLTYIVTKKGEGAQLKAGDNIIVNYTGLFTDGRKFDSSLDPGREQFSFPLGAGRVIKGWDEGFAKLNVGDHATFIIPSTLPYAQTARGVIPPNTTLIFIVEVIGVK